MKKRRAFGTVIERPPRPGFYALFTWEGRRYCREAGPRVSTAEQKLAAAHALLKGGVRVQEVLAQVFGDIHGERLTFRDAVPLYMKYAATKKKPSTVASDQSRIQVLLRAPWAAKYLVSIRAQDLIRWAEERIGSGVTSSTANRDLALGSALFRWAMRLGYVEENPFRRVERFSEKGRAREVYLTAAESRALVKVASPALRPVLVCALSTGMRRGELLALQWCDIEFARRVIVVRPEAEKTGRGRTVPMTGDLLNEMQGLREGTKIAALDGSDRVFVYEDGTPIGLSSLRAMFASAVKRCAEIPLEKKDKVTFHTLRHTAASLMVQAGVGIPEVGKILGHSTLAVTMRYAHFAPEAGRAAIDRLGGVLGLGNDGEQRATGQSGS